MKVKTLSVGELGTNCYIVTENGTAVVIDPADECERIVSALEGDELSGILLTHGHFDHTGAVNELKKRYGCEIIISAEDEEMLSDNKKNAAFLIGAFPSPITADKLVKDGDIIEIGSLSFEVISTPGHTKGSVTYKIDDSLFTGDTLFKGTVGRCDLYGGNSARLIESLEKLATLDDSFKVYPGHDQKTTIGYEKQTNYYMRKRK